MRDLGSRLWLSVASAILAAPSCAADQPRAEAPTARSRAASSQETKAVSAATWAFEVVAEYPHDPSAYTQGLVFVGDELWESTGNYGESSIRRTDFNTGTIRRQVGLPPDLFGEGLAFVDDGFWQLTWYAGKALRWNRALDLVGSANYEGQGWGLCFDGRLLWRSDGSGDLVSHNPDTFAVADRVQFHDLAGPVRLLNELECVGGLVYANVYTYDQIMILDPGEGRVVARVDAAGLRRRLGEAAAGAEALNGIAYHSERQTFFVTGKYWPKTFEIRFNPNQETTENVQ